MSRLLVALLLIGSAISDKISGDDYEQYEQNFSPTPVIDNVADNEIRIDRTNSKHRGSSSYSHNEDDGSYDGTWVDTIPGRSGEDFPSYAEIPKTSFTCKGKMASGYFADVETDCQVFHICMDEIHKISFLCPNGSIFNQKVLVCDWWYDVDCQSSADHLEIYNEATKQHELQQDFIFDNFALDEVYDLNLASSGGNENPKQTTENILEQTTKNVKVSKQNNRKN